MQDWHPQVVSTSRGPRAEWHFQSWAGPLEAKHPFPPFPVILCHIRLGYNKNKMLAAIPLPWQQKALSLPYLLDFHAQESSVVWVAITHLVDVLSLPSITRGVESCRGFLCLVSCCGLRKAYGRSTWCWLIICSSKFLQFTLSHTISRQDIPFCC